MAVSIWYKGFSRQSDNWGLVRVKLVDEFLANESQAVRLKAPQRFMSEPAYRAVKKWGDGKESSAIVKEKAYRNLSQRNWVIPGQGFSLSAMGFKVTPVTPVIDFNSPPEAQKAKANLWERTEIFDETHPAILAGTEFVSWCTDWNPATGTPEWWLEKVKERVAAIKAAPGGPSGFGVR